MRSIKTEISFFKKKTDKEAFLEDDRRMMVLKTPRELNLSVIFIGRNGTRISYPANEMLNSWMEISEYTYFYIRRARVGLKCEIELAII